MEGENVPEREEATESPEHLANLVYTYFSRIWNQLKFQGDKIFRELGAYQLIDTVAQQSAKHPFAALGISIGTLIFALPILLLVIFAFTALVMTFTGFILIEGTLITVTSVLLFGCLGAGFIVFVFCGAVALAGYFGFMHVYDIFNSLNDRSVLNNFVRPERFRGLQHTVNPIP